MGMMDKAREAIGRNRDKIDQGMQKAAKLAKEKAGAQHADKVDRIVERGRDTLDRMDDSNQSDRSGRPDPTDRPNPQP